MKPTTGMKAAPLCISMGVAIVAPVLIVMQPFLPRLLQTSVLITLLVLSPLLVMVFRPGIIVWPPLFCLITLVLLTGENALVQRTNEFMLTAVSLIASIFAFRFGAYLATKPDLERVWDGLAIGVTALNLITFGYFIGLSHNVIDINALFEIIQRDVTFNLDRFALGNPIIVPLIMTALLYAAVRLGRSEAIHLSAVIINCTTAVMSQSRLIILIAGMLLLRQLWMVGLPLGAGMTGAIALTISLQWDLVEPVIDLVLDRMRGNDSGSADDRQWLVVKALDSIAPINLLFGDGLTSSAELVLRHDYVYRTVESLLLEWLLEVGLSGIVLIVFCLSWRLSKDTRSFSWPTPITLLLWVQVLIFLPSHGMMMACFFVLGALSHTRPLLVPRTVLIP